MKSLTHREQNMVAGLIANEDDRRGIKEAQLGIIFPSLFFKKI